MVVSVISIIGSSMRRITCATARPIDVPTTAPSPTTVTNSSARPPTDACRPATTPRTRVKNTIAVPSLSRLSPSTSRRRRRGVPRLLNSPTTAIGSVAAISAPNTSAVRQSKSSMNSRRSATGTSSTVVRRIAAITPGTASPITASRLRRNSAASTWNAASNSRPGRKTANRSSLVRCGASNTCRVPSVSPATTRATVYGICSRRDAIATVVATMNSRRKALSSAMAVLATAAHVATSVRCREQRQIVTAFLTIAAMVRGEKAPFLRATVATQGWPVGGTVVQYGDAHQTARRVGQPALELLVRPRPDDDRGCHPRVVDDAARRRAQRQRALRSLRRHARRRSLHALHAGRRPDHPRRPHLLDHHRRAHRGVAAVRTAPPAQFHARPRQPDGARNVRRDLRVLRDRARPDPRRRGLALGAGAVAGGGRRSGAGEPRRADLLHPPRRGVDPGIDADRGGRHRHRLGGRDPVPRGDRQRDRGGRRPRRGDSGRRRHEGSRLRRRLRAGDRPRRTHDTRLRARFADPARLPAG